MYPSILIIPKPMSDWDETTMAAVILFPSISIISPSRRSNFSMHAGSILATEFPTSACENASATFNFISLPVIIIPLLVSYNELYQLKLILNSYNVLVNSSYYNILYVIIYIAFGFM